MEARIRPGLFLMSGAKEICGLLIIHQDHMRRELRGPYAPNYCSGKSECLFPRAPTNGRVAQEVYRELEDVLEYHKDTFTPRETLRPKLVAMAGANEFEPYKD